MLFRDDEREREVIVINKGSVTGRAPEFLTKARKEWLKIMRGKAY